MSVDVGGRSSDRGVSTVIGIVLMISVVVVLASVVAVYLTSIGQPRQGPAPTMGADARLDHRTTGNGQYLNVTYTVGSAIDTAKLTIRVKDAESVDPGGSEERGVYTGSVLSEEVGSTLTVSETVSLDRTDFEEADGDPITGSESLDLTDASVTIYWRGDQSSKPIYEWAG